MLGAAKAVHCWEKQLQCVQSVQQRCANVQMQSVKSVRCAVSGVRVAGVPSGPQGKQTKRICCDWGGKYPPPKKLKPDFSRSIKGQKGGHWPVRWSKF